MTERQAEPSAASVDTLSRNVGLDLIRVTEAAALAAGRWIGSGQFAEAHRAATVAMQKALSTLRIDGCVVIGEDRPVGDGIPLSCGTLFGAGGTLVDLAVDPIDGTRLLVEGRPGAISVVAVTPRGSLFSPGPAEYLDKIVTDREAADVLVPECMDAPAAWTLALIARAKKKTVRDLVVVVLARARHQDLIQEIRATGARILLRDEGDAEGALVAATQGTKVDVLMGVGGAGQGVLSACAVRALRGGMLARFAPQTADERNACAAAGLETQRIMTANDLVRSDEIFFAATGITDSSLLNGITYKGSHAETHSLLIRSVTGTRRFIQAEHTLGG
jgi:fructose-1,6-bisphosphatase II